jgi:hypothetical protein
LESTRETLQRQHFGKVFNVILRRYLPVAALRYLETGFANDRSELAEFSARTYHPDYSGAKIKEENSISLLKQQIIAVILPGSVLVG